MPNHTFSTMGLDDPEAWDCDVAEYMCCIESYEGQETSRIELCDDGYYDLHFPDGHVIPGVAGFHLDPEPGNSDAAAREADAEYYLDF